MIDTLAKAFTQAGADLGEALVTELESRDPVLCAKVRQAMQGGYHLQLTVEFDPVTPMVTLNTVAPTGDTRRVMRIGGRTPGSLQ